MPLPFEHLRLWCDATARSGPANMAVDEWLLETAVVPVLRVYRWEPGWGSIGYFGSHAEARQLFPDLTWVRRWTGGGTVDHREDWTYTLVVPDGESLSKARGAESYRVIHAALAAALQIEGRSAVLSGGELQTGAATCFENPVCHDLIDGQGRKIAGAGQRRTRTGLLHQGSLGGTADDLVSEERAVRLGRELAGQLDAFSGGAVDEEIERRSTRYIEPKWTNRVV